MYAALLNKRIVLAVDEANLVRNNEKKLNYENYRCPQCHKKLILIISESKSAFFKHLAQCRSQYGEKEEHHNSKMLLKSAFTAAGFDAKVEVPLADGGIRADVLISEKLAIEVQCAPLSQREFIHRHNLYQQVKILDLWIVGKRHYLNKQLKETQLIFFRENKNWGTYYLEVNPQKQVLQLKYNIWQEPMTRNLVYQTKIFSLDECGINEFWHFKAKKKIFQLNKNDQKQYLWRQIHQKTNLGHKIASQLYELGMNIDDLPDKVFSQFRKPGEIDGVSKYLCNKKGPAPKLDADDL
ncbi:competence protein CoiA [Lactobacillus kalixensis]|nr:competence protein CoiA family protein [Lactobacillus kalixensis]